MTDSDTLSIINLTKGKLPSLPFVAMRDEILGKNYELSIAFVPSAHSKSLNKKWRGKDKPTNILSFSLSKKSGELVLCPLVVKKEAPAFGKSFSEFIGFLVIHGMLHLKGMEHGSIMEKLEQKYDSKYFGRHRHRHGDSESRRGRIPQRRKRS